MAFTLKNNNSRVRVRFVLVIYKVVLKTILSATIPFLLSWVPKPPISAPPNVDNCSYQVSRSTNDANTSQKLIIYRLLEKREP